MQQLRILNSKDIKELNKIIISNWGCELETDCALLQSSRDKIYLISKNITQLDLSKMRMDVVGLYIGELHENRFRLSIEGSQIIGPKAAKNVVEVSESEMRNWLKGNDVDNISSSKGDVILKCGNDYIGCGSAGPECIKNFVPKNRRILSND